jgi:protoporphyrinogen oxidase
MESWLLHLKKYLEHNGVVFREEEVTDLKSSLKDSSLVVLATPPRAAAQLLRTLNDPRAALLEKIEMLPVASVTLLTEKSAPLQGFGCLFPATENFHSLGVLFRQSFFPEDGAPPQERWILRGDSLNGDIGPKHIQQISESDILARVESDRHRLWGANAPQVTAQHIKLWDEAMPHYTTDLESQLVTLSGDAFTGSGPVFLHGNYLGALGLTALLERSFTLSEEIAKEC